MAADAVARREPHVLDDALVAVDRQLLARLVAAGEVGDEALNERDQRRRVVDPRLRIRDAELDRPVRGRRGEGPTTAGWLRERAAVAGPDRELGELAPARERGRHARAGPALVQLGRTVASPVSSPP